VLCVFDVNETLLDLAGLDDLFASVTGHAEARREWFALMIHNALTLTAAGAYRPFGEIGAACLPPIAARYGRTATSDDQRELGVRMRDLRAHPDAADALRRLRDAGHRVVTLTNSIEEVAEDQLRHSGLRDLVETAYSADRVGRLKPAPEPYRLVLENEGVAPSDAVLVAAHDWDVAGAHRAGLRTAFVSRDGGIPLPAGDAPTVSVSRPRSWARTARASRSQAIRRRPPYARTASASSRSGRFAAASRRTTETRGAHADSSGIADSVSSADSRVARVSSRTLRLRGHCVRFHSADSDAA
jgi:2-haloacid dehalogenase